MNSNVRSLTNLIFNGARTQIRQVQIQRYCLTATLMVHLVAGVQKGQEKALPPEKKDSPVFKTAVSHLWA